ncbi:MAG: alpha-N-acetylglucosaminidase [Bacteroidaceae bacterium]|nr:alpha-N-acetylglucosaminidase [Bacteroidaceae bacterium]
MKRFLSFLWFEIFFVGMAFSNPIDDMLCRILPNNGDAAKFKCIVTGGDTQQFTISCNGRKVKVSGSDRIAVAAGINWYLQHYAGVDISWNSPTGTLPTRLPVCAKETHTASVDWRYYLNFCTYSYSMSFWDWERWQQELDWMALHGINMPLAITGMECVWKEVLMHSYGYTLEEVNTFVTGSAYYGWFFMNNITAWGGPQPESWYSQQQTLGRKIFQRMKDFGMHPVIPGYVGMIPKDFMMQAEASKIAGWNAFDIVNGGNWCSFVRPYFVNNTDRLKEFAHNYYAAFRKLYGDVCTTHFYAIDPFHEGGVPRGVTSAEESVKAMWEALTAYDKNAVWVAQHWQNNPTTNVTHTISRGRLIILDLHGDQYADTSCSGQHTTSDGQPHDWVWGQVSNFGGNVGLFGRVDRLIECFYTARNAKGTNGLVGIGALPEGIENNAMLYDLLYALPWTNTDYTRTTWISDYVRMRYGLYETNGNDVTFDAIRSVWTRLGAGIYQCPNNYQQGTTESVFMMRPSLTASVVSTWAASTWYWDIADLRVAFREMLSVSDALSDNDNYRYDLVDIARQALADYGKELLDKIKENNVQADKNRFLELILDQDRLLGTRAEFRLGRWTEAARALGNTMSEKNLYEKNARMLLTTWGDRAQCESGRLHDYANREWNGLLSAYYYPRWKAFFDNANVAQNWFDDFEWPFAMGESCAYGTFSATPEGDELVISRELYDKYLRNLIK